MSILVMKKIVFSTVFALLLSSCSFFSSNADKLRQENDSLRIAKEEMENEVNGYFQMVNQIQANLDQITEIEKYLTSVNNKEGIEMSQSEQINLKIAQVNDLLEKNATEISSLRSKLKRSNVQIQELNTALSRLTLLLEEKSREIDNLEVELAKKDELIQVQELSIKGLQGEVANLEENNAIKDSTISLQDEEIHSAWYAFGTRKELKAEKIISEQGLFVTSKVLQQDFNKDYFIKIDMREVKAIPLYTKRAKILTTHPANSFNLNKSSGQYVIEIINSKEFWSVSRYLVVEVD